MVDYIEIIITFALGLGIAYMIFKKTGLEAKFKRIKENNLEQMKTGWGVDEVKRITAIQIKELLKNGRKANKNLIIGVNEIGKVSKILKVKEVSGTMTKIEKEEEIIKKTKEKKEIMYLFEVKSGLLSTKISYFLIKEEEITDIDKKTIKVKDGVIFSSFGIYYITDDYTSKRDYVMFLVDKMNSEDVYGRISNLASKVIYLEPSHAMAMDLLERKLEFAEKQMGEGSERKAVDFLGA